MSDVEIGDWFWDLVGRAAGSADRLRRLLAPLDRTGLFEFAQQFSEASVELDSEGLAAHLGPLPDDAYEAVCHLVVSGGRERFLEVIADPKRAPRSIVGHERENIFGVAEQLYQERYGDYPSLYDADGRPVKLQ